MVRLLARVIGLGIETADMLVHEVLSRNCAIAGQLPATPGSQARLTRAADNGARKGWHDRATPVCAAA